MVFWLTLQTCEVKLPLQQLHAAPLQGFRVLATLTITKNPLIAGFLYFIYPSFNIHYSRSHSIFCNLLRKQNYLNLS